MDCNKKPWPIASVFGIRERVDTRPDYQRPAVWTQSQKQLLIDTILRSYDIPKLYWRKVGSGPDRYEVVDGQQRLRAIWEYCSGELALPRDADPIDGCQIAGMKYAQLPDDLRIAFDTYALDVIVLSEVDEEEVREMFLRLQNGTSLKAQEKRNAMPGRMRDFVKELAGHPLFAHCGFTNARYLFDHVSAQVTLIELTGGPCHVKNANLNAMYRDQAEFEAAGPKAKKIRRVLDYLLRMFPEKTPELERFNVISLYVMVSQLLERYVVPDRGAEIASWFLDFETHRRAQAQLSEDEADPEMVVYHEKTSHSTDALDSIQWRHDFLMRKLFEAVPDIELKDDQREFSREQRLAIFRRDGSICQVCLRCDGARCEWDNWAADHLQPHSLGGKTTVANGQVACIACNSAKGNSANA